MLINSQSGGLILSLLVFILCITSGNAQLAEGKCKFLGNVIGSSVPLDFDQYWNQVTPENAGKWQSLEPTQDGYNWNAMDIAYNYAKSNGIPFKHHTFIWGNQQPGWIETLDPEEQLAEIEEMMELVCSRYPDIAFIDVVNEPLHDPPTGPGNGNYIDALGGAGDTGWDWVINSFELARGYCPNAKLHLNDYGIINDNTRTTQYLAIIKLLNDRGLIDGIGVQGHRFELEGAQVNTLKANLDRLAATDLPIYISEFDLGNVGNTGTPNDNQQLELYKKIFPVLWNHSAVHGITLWGYRENQTWQETAFLKRSNNIERPALAWLKEFVAESYGGTFCYPVTSVEDDNSTFSVYPNPSFDGVITISIPAGAREIAMHDLKGATINTIRQNFSEATQIVWTAPKGIYLLQVKKRDTIITRKLVVN